MSYFIAIWELLALGTWHILLFGFYPFTLLSRSYFWTHHPPNSLNLQYFIIIININITDLSSPFHFTMFIITIVSLPL
ncbi:hypothetical protein L1987_23415 [Smallanthus sonchifolius]|uniref:Uncharacterized protein n=1 Tax=Smallanthus sonchifolius TaxID=185202 RepID=A0ACB9IJC6_9ASTR|nr:hypothetical protein L1987_23415 [Smallanthus sonchifolius]